MEGDPSSPHARFFVRMAARTPELIERISARLRLEFAPPELVEERDAGEGLHLGWTGLGPLPADRLSGVQRHLDRVRELYSMGDSGAVPALEAGYLDPFKVVRACGANGPDATFAGDGVWAGTILRRVTGSDALLLLPGVPDAWRGIAFLEFLSRLERTPLTGPSAGHAVSDASGCR